MPPIRNKNQGPSIEYKGLKDQAICDLKSQKILVVINYRVK